MSTPGNRKAHRGRIGPASTRLIIRGLALLCAVSVALELAIPRQEPFAFADWFGFNAAAGLLACLLLMLGAHGLRRLVLRPENYYSEGKK